MRDRLTVADEVFARARYAEAFVGKSAGPGFGWAGQGLLALRVVQRVIEPGYGARSVAKRRMDRHVLDALAIDPHLAPVAQAFEILGAGKGAALVGDRVLGPFRRHFDASRPG